MTRSHTPRRVGFLTRVIQFRPAGVRMSDLEEVVLGNDELEAIRLKDLLGMSQAEAAREMHISQPTFHRLLLSARQKIADAFVNGKAVRIDGGNIDVDDDFSQPCHWRKRWGCKARAECDNDADRVETRTGGSGIVHVAVTSTDGTLDGLVDERFGRSKKIILFDKGSRSFEVIDNMANMNAPQGAGIETARNVARTKAQALISGHLGPNAFQMLKVAGIEAYTASAMTVREALATLDEGRLTRMAGADVEGHWREENAVKDTGG
jgi:predicted DNA-binding protein (UPF0251 family)/predicted Fe-Mo cluster-binding NifX family protein